MRVKKMISLNISQLEAITVPEGEYWKCSIGGTKNAGEGINIVINEKEISLREYEIHKMEFVENSTIQAGKYAKFITMEGLAFEI